MANDTKPTFDFLTDYVLALLEENDITLSDEQKRTYVPELLAEVEQRLGGVLLPKLSDEQLETLNTMLEKGDATPKDWETFWKEALPSFEEDVKATLRDFATEVRDLLAA